MDTVATAGAVDDAADVAQVFDNISDGFSYGDDDEDDITDAWGTIFLSSMLPRNLTEPF